MGKLIKTKTTSKHPIGTILEGEKIKTDDGYNWKIYDLKYKEEWIRYPEDYPVQYLDEYRREQIEKVFED